MNWKLQQFLKHKIIRKVPTGWLFYSDGSCKPFYGTRNQAKAIKESLVLKS